MSITIDTVGACLAHRYEVRAFCGCGHWDRVDLLAVSLKHGEGYKLDRLWASLRCTKCRSRRVNAQIVPLWNPYPGAPSRFAK